MAKDQNVSAPTPAEARPGRLEGKTVLITGAAGNLGGPMTRAFLREGARVILTGRSREKTLAAAEAASAAVGAPEGSAYVVTLDGGDPASVRAAVAEVVDRFGSIDVLINNAGSAGPKAAIGDLPFTDEDLAERRAAGFADEETVPQAIRNLLGVSWNLVRAVAPHMPEGGSIVNVSTIFSRTAYYGRSAYTAPKAAMNAWSRALARELGPRGVRVNLVYPGPIASERIRNAFAAMDALKGDAQGETEREVVGRMRLKRRLGDRPLEATLPVPDDVAAACLFFSSDDSAALSGCEIEVTHGMAVPREERSSLLARPSMRSIDGQGAAVLIAAGDGWEDALEVARVQIACGARVLLGLSRQADVAIAEKRAKAEGLGEALEIVRLHRGEPAQMEAALHAYASRRQPISGAVIMPFFAAGEFEGDLAGASDETVERFMTLELGGALAIARALSRHWRESPLARPPRYVFLTAPSDGRGDAYSEILGAATDELVRIWRGESASDLDHGRRAQAEWGNLIVRHTNAEAENLRFAAGHAAAVLLRDSRIQETSLHLPSRIGEATGALRPVPEASENITGLHLGKVALITGGSAGIGGQVARLLAIAGAKVMMVARREGELAAARERIVTELREIGFAGAEARVKVMGGVDVADLPTLDAAVDRCLETFGRIDYLINNAGVAGAEEMVVDMGLEAWTYTLDANLVSNYALAARVAPLMKAQGSGYILNVSSYFGGEKYLAVAYPNRSDYAVSKSGQRAMVEAFARFLGPEVQFNAIAPGPVAGDRLVGVGGRPGLFERRGKLILENKRLNAVHAAVVKAIRRGNRVEAVLSRLARNDTVRMSHDPNNPKELRDLALACAREGDGVCAWDRHLLTPALARRLVRRLRRGGYFLDAPDWRERPADDEADGAWLLRAPPEDQPFLPKERVAAEAEKVGKGVLSQLYLGKMPTEAEVALATVFFLADRAVSGETFMPSGGLNVERSTTERELFGSPNRERLEEMRGRTVWLIGESLAEHLAETIRDLTVCGVGRIALITRTPAGADEVLNLVADEAPPGIERVLVEDGDLEGAMDRAHAAWGRPVTVVSTPFESLPDRLFAGPAPLGVGEFRQIVAAHLTHHFRVARKASLYDGCQLVLTSPDAPMGNAGPAFALANFLKTTLHAFTATLAVENERLVHQTPVNQLNLTRRVRSEEPRDLDEHIEEVKRFARGALLLGAPLPDAEDSRYRARIYRGMSMTV